MITEEIERRDWSRFLEEFSRSHAGWIVTLQEVDSDLGDQEEINLLPLIGIGSELHGPERRIRIVAGRDRQPTVDHLINQPKQLWFRRSAIEGYEAIDIESETGTKAVIEFRAIPLEEIEKRRPRHFDRVSP